MTESGSVPAAGPVGPIASALGPLWEVLRPYAEPVGTWMALPSSDRPRLLLPLDARTPVAWALRDYLRNSRPAARLGGTVFSKLMAAGLPLPLGRSRRTALSNAGAEDLRRHLSELLGEPVVPVFHLGTERANRKPVLYLLAPDGRLVALAKVASGPLVLSLLEREHRALRQLMDGPLAGITVARPLAVDTWRGIRFYIQSPLPLRSARSAPPLARMLDAAAVLGRKGRHTASLRASLWWRSLREAAEGADGGAGQRLGELLRAIETDHADLEMSFGAMHGDLSPWNAASRSDRVLLWDWERFEPAAPAGLDALHYSLYLNLMKGVARTMAVGRVLADAPRLLAACGVGGDAWVATSRAYAASLATRYLTEDAPQRARRLAESLVSDALILIPTNGIGGES